MPCAQLSHRMSLGRCLPGLGGRADGVTAHESTMRCVWITDREIASVCSFPLTDALSISSSREHIPKMRVDLVRTPEREAHVGVMRLAELLDYMSRCLLLPHPSFRVFLSRKSKMLSRYARRVWISMDLVVATCARVNWPASTYHLIKLPQTGRKRMVRGGR